MKIRKIETVDYEGPVYNIEVEDNHNYYVNDILVSNCHENSTVNGKHADLKALLPMLDTMVGGTEVAIGGGNALSHPDLGWFVNELNNRGIIANITINQKHLKPFYDDLMDLYIKHGNVMGIGVSLTDHTNKEDFEIINKMGPNVVIHTIAGVLKPEDYHRLYGRKILILGYKDLRRGHDNLSKHSAEIQANIEQLKKDLPMLERKCKLISFDCLGLEQLNPKETLGMPDDKFNLIYQGHDYDMFDKDGNITVSTLFIDAVNMKVSRSSTSQMDKRYSFTGKEDIRELLAKSCEGY